VRVRACTSMSQLEASHICVPAYVNAHTKRAGILDPTGMQRPAAAHADSSTSPRLFSAVPYIVPMSIFVFVTSNPGRTTAQVRDIIGRQCARLRHSVASPPLAHIMPLRLAT